MRAMLLASAAALAWGSAQAQQATSDQALERMRGFQTTGTPLEAQTVPQTGRRADQIRRNLERIRLPPGFRIDLYAVVPDARHMAVSRNNANVFVGTRKTDFWVVVDRDKDRVADEVKRMAPAIRFTQPNPCYSPDGFLYVVEHNRVLVFPAIEFFHEGPDVAVDVVVPQGELIPREEESFNHGHRVCRIGPDNKLYISLGQPYNVHPPEKYDLYNRLGIGGIIRMSTVRRSSVTPRTKATGQKARVMSPLRSTMSSSGVPLNGMKGTTDASAPTSISTFRVSQPKGQRA